MPPCLGGPYRKSKYIWLFPSIITLQEVLVSCLCSSVDLRSRRDSCHLTPLPFICMNLCSCVAVLGMGSRGGLLIVVFGERAGHSHSLCLEVYSLFTWSWEKMVEVEWCPLDIVLTLHVTILLFLLMEFGNVWGDIEQTLGGIVGLCLPGMFSTAQGKVPLP